MEMRIFCTTLSLVLWSIRCSQAFLIQQSQQKSISRSSSSSSSALLRLSAASNRRSSYVEEYASKQEEEERGGGVGGAQFFGGTKIDQDLFDPVAEANAAMSMLGDQNVYVKWEDTDAFPSARVQAVAKSIQGTLNSVLYTEDGAPENVDYSYDKNMVWETPLSKEKDAKTPLDQLALSLEFYKRLDIAITSGSDVQSSDNLIQLRWEISVMWPAVWDPRVLVTGTSILTLDGTSITRQVDTLDNPDLLSTLQSQLKPRFWDLYHLGMSPSTELLPKFPVKGAGFFTSYSLYDLPPRLVYQPTILDEGTREAANAATIPNHSFCDFIVTTGPRRQRYVTTTPLEVQVARTTTTTSAGGGSIVSDGEVDLSTKLTFNIPVSVELQSSPLMPLPPLEDKEENTPKRLDPQTKYVFQSERRVATIPYGGQPQDEEVVEIRKKLYEQITKDGLKPKLDESGRPQFFFWSYNVKNCFIDSGLGMAIYVYHWKGAKSNAVGIELEVPTGREIATAS